MVDGDCSIRFVGAYPRKKEYKMNRNCAVIRKKPIPEAFRGKVYLDPTYDPAFKELFASKDALKDFLDGVLGLDGNDKIKDLRFRFEEPVEFRVPQRKKVIFDIFATTGSGRFLNIEMQRVEHDFFIDRAILYKAFLVIKGRKEMEESPEFKALPGKEQKKCRYQLPETVSIWICDFDLPYATGEYLDEWALYSRHSVDNGSAVPLSEKNRYIFLSVPNFTKSADEVNGAAEMWLYLLNHARDGGELPAFGSGIVEEALERIRVENAADELLSDQEKDMSLKEDYQIVLASATIRAQEEGLAKGLAEGREKGLAEGLAEGREKGLAEGRAKGLAEGQRQMADFLRSKGVSEELIAEALDQK